MSETSGTQAGVGGINRVTAEDGIRDVVGDPSDLVLKKQLDYVDEHSRAFISLSPMVMVASSAADGRCDASPRGDPPGFVRVLDRRTLLIPDRKGNRRVDTMRNVIENPQIGLLFLVPGRPDTVRVNGTATITDDAELLAQCAVDGKAPALGIVVEVEELFFHCARSFIRSSLWRPEGWPDISTLPTLGTILRDHATAGEISAGELDQDLDAANRDLY